MSELLYDDDDSGGDRDDDIVIRCLLKLKYVYKTNCYTNEISD